MAGERQTIITPNLVTSDKPKDTGERPEHSEIIENPLRDSRVQKLMEKNNPTQTKQ